MYVVSRDSMPSLIGLSFYLGVNGGVGGGQGDVSSTGVVEQNQSYSELISILSLKITLIQID